ncbi:LOW QUALITY PROTEIN: hydrocephalus-inducing protein [Bombus terrestris]|uniref:LOW QUALITY PROTEIN: hydrocephalus-inducing protein n=1 Tax=Bombus terrestris TaxID=30195 RepID=A0A9C6WA21_BOMTE|nr:LOW QUALITY PROTEIN: hydrocephalus-inducing protein [Bombus terrestris]
MICSLCNNQGYVKAHQSKTMEAVIITKTLGPHKVMLNMLVMGEPSSVSSHMVIACNGQGPVVSAEPTSLDFGEVKVLEEKTMEFQLINDSPVPTQFIATLKSEDSLCSVSPESGDLEPHESMIITVKLCLVEPGKYKDKIMLRVINSRIIPVEVKGTGYGCSVVFEPQIFPTFDWGLLFSHQQIDRTITLTNKGTHDYQMIWITEPEVRFRRGQMLMSHTTKFQLHPSIVNIPPGETRHVYCKLFWKANECVVEKWNVFGQFHGIGKRELIGTSSFTVTLTEPQILFSKRRLTFRVDVCPEEDKLQQIDELLVTNQSKLDLNVQLSVREPFHLITSAEEHVQSMQIVLIDGGTTKIRVFFSFNGDTEDCYSKNYSGILRLEYQEHPNQDKITCKGYVNFPNLDIQPSDFVINCELGTSAEEILTLTNNGPISVVYKFLWLADSIDIQRDSDVVPECSGCSSRKAKLEADTAEMQEVEVADEVHEDIYTSDKQDGVGDGPLDTIPPPTNSPISENQSSEIPLTEKISEIHDCLVSAKEIRNFLMPIVGSYFKADEDLVVLESMQTDPPRNDYINEVLKIVPNEGTVLPYSVQRVHVGFHGFERLRIKAIIVCEIFRGPTERIHLLARADAIRYAIDTNVIDFGQQIGHLMPVTIEVIAYGAFPQVYLCIPRGKMHQYHSIELEYSAIQSLTEDFIVNKIGNIVAKKINDLLETDMEMLADMKHVIVERTAHYSANVINYGPWNVEMRMKMENKKDHPGRSGIIVHFRKHSKLLVGDSAILQVTWHPTRERFSEKSTEVKHMIYIEVLYGCTIPVTIKGIVTYPYVTVNTKFLDFQDVVVGECLVLHILIKNDGLVDCEWEARLSDVHRKKQHEDYPFYVEYDTNYCPPGHFEIVRCYIETRLKIIVKMSPETQIVAITGRGIEKRLNIIEPTIQFLPTIPYTNIQEVVFTIENTCNYPVEFFWHHLDDVFQMEDHITKALLYYYKVKEILLPPRKPGESIPWQLTKFYRDIINEMAQALIMEKLNEEEIFEEEVQLERRSHEGDTGKKRERMTRSSVLKRKTRKRGRSIQQSTTRKSSVRESSRRGKRNEVVSDLSSTDSGRKDCPDFPILNETLLESIPLPTSDPEEIQHMLFCYIDSLYKSSDFQSRMKDPVKELFENIQRKSDVSNNIPDPSKPEKRVCVIFHGAPFTEYQEVACRSARVLEIPVLSIDKAITEVTALSGSPCSIQLRQIIDDAYEIYSEAFVKQKQRLISQDAREGNEVGSESTRKTGTSSKRRSSLKEKSSRTGGSPKTSKKLKTSKAAKIQSSDAQREAILRLHADPDPLVELDKIPTNEKLEMLDALSRYEYKIQAILLLQKIVDHCDIHDSPRDRGDRSLRKKKDSFLGITSELIAEALEERLSMEDFKRGFVVQSLECNFLRNNTLEALLSLLRIVGNIEYLLFVTFLNSMACYDTRIEQLQKEIELPTAQKTELFIFAAMKATDPNQKIQDIDEMSSSEYDQLPDEDKKMYLDAILPLKRAEASRRRARFIERMMERTKKKENRSYVSSLNTTKKKRNAKSTRHVTAASNSRPASSKRGTSKATRSRDSSKRRKESVSSEVKEITATMDRYYTDLSSIEAVIRNWDPIRKTIETASTTKSKASRSARSKDVSPLDTVPEVPANNFHIWYVRSSDPWQDTMYDLVVAQMNENLLAKSALPVEIIPVPDLRPKLYSVLRWKDVEKRAKRILGDVYQLVSLTSMPEIFSVDESNAVSEVSVQENYTIAKRNRRRRGRKTSKTEEQKSLNRAENRSVNASTIGSKDTNSASFLETIREESLKPRWILLPSESQRFKIRFQPEESGHYEEVYALTLLDGNYITYEVNVTGVADIPRLDMNPKTIFAKTANAKLNEAESSTYFYDKELYDFGSQLVLRKDRRPHRREARLKFCNISEVEVEVRVSLTENDSQCFFVQPQQLLIARETKSTQRGSCATLILSAIATRLGIITGKLFLCVTNNPKVEVIELQSKGTMLDIELDEKELSFGRILLYRIEYRTLTIRNKTPVPFFWYLEAEEPADPQITFTPFHGVIETRSEQKIEFCYHATTVGVVRKKAITFKAFLDEDDNDPIFYDVVLISGETYDVAVDINYANPIDLKYIKVNFAAKTTFSMRNRGDYEVKYVITMEDKEKLAKLNLPANFKKKLEIEPATGTVSPNQEKTVEMIFKAKTELTLKEAPILKCHLVDTHKETTVIAEIPLNVSLVAYYTRFRINPYPVVNFGALAMCTEKTMYLNIENIGKFPLHYSIRLLHKHPSVMYMTKALPKEFPKKTSLAERRTTSKKGKKSARSVKTETKIHSEPERLIIGPITIMKTEGTVDVDQADSIAISCYPEFVGSQEEQIIIVVDNSIPEDREGKTVTLSMNSFMPTIDFQDLDSTFQENRVVDRIQDFDCPKDVLIVSWSFKTMHALQMRMCNLVFCLFIFIVSFFQIGAHTVFARQEKSLYFRYINVLSTHVTCFKLHNRGVVAANVEIRLMEESLTPNTAKYNTFIIEPTNDQIPPMSHKVFTVSFTPHIIETFQETFRAAVVLPSHLEADQLFIKLIGESCVPEVAITEPVHGARERPTLNFPRTLIDESSYRYLALENIGFIKAKVIVKIDEDLNNVFLFSACSDTQHLLQIWQDYCDGERNKGKIFARGGIDATIFILALNPSQRYKERENMLPNTCNFVVSEPRDRCIVVRLAPGNVARFKVIFAPTEIGKQYGKIRLHVIDNPYENLSTNLEGECYVEPIVLDGLQFEENKRKVVTENHKVRRASSKQNSLVSASSNSMHSASLTYILDYGLCFVSKMYKKTFKIANKSTDRWFRFQWSAHPHVVFEPSIGHIKYLTCKEIVATFLAPEPANYENIRIECLICEILVEYSQHELVGWDDRQTEVRWERVHHDLMDRISNIDLFLKKIVEPTIEAKHEILAGTNRSIDLLLNAIVAFSECLCTVEEICFNDTLMFQTREYKFFLSNPGIVDTVFAWKINMDEQYPKRYIGDSSNVTSRPRTAEETRSQNSRSSRGIFSATSELGRRNFGQDESSAGVNTNILSRRCMSFVSDSVDMKDASSTKQSDLFSSTAGLSGRTTDSWLEGDDLPFVIYPETGTISPGQSVECTLKFSPKDVFYYKAYLTCNIENHESKQPNLTIPVVARSLLPYCHFDVQDSDYVTSGRRDPSLPGPLGYEIDDPTLWQNIRVIEFKVVGVAGTHVKKFHLINPTVDDYYFSWTNRSALGPGEISNFHCAVTEGIAERGKRTDLAFTFLAENVGVFESFWLFSIDRYNLECLFLLVGIVIEPSVYCLTIHVKLKPTILGFNVRDSLKILNNEDFHIPFSVLEESLYSEGKFQKLSVTPMTGTLISKSEQHFWVEYHPTQVGEFHFSIQCAVKLMKNPLTMFVTASVYDIVSSVSYCKLNGEIVRASESKENVIDLGKIMPEVSINLKFDITNACKVAFYYAWELGMTPEISCRNAYSVTTSQKQGHVTSENRSACYLTLTTYQKVTIKDHCVLLKISNGPTYKFTLKATSKRPAIEFSFNRYDFGPCYIQQHNAISYCAELRVTNSDDVAFIIECKFEEQPHLSVDLNSISEALAARSTITIPIVFRPLKEIKYHECLVFTINSANEKRITIIGEGIGYKRRYPALHFVSVFQVRLVNPRDQSIDLGNVPARKSVVRKIPVINEGLAPLDLRFGIMKYLNDYDEYRENQRYCDPSDDESEMAQASIVEIKRSWTTDQRFTTGEPKLLDVLKIEPSSSVVLKRNKRVNVLVTFKSPSRMRSFETKVAFQSSSMILPLFSVRGSCVGAEFRLNRNHIFFGTVVQGCTEESKVILMNTGDLGSRFKWNTSKLPKDFQIAPMSGYCSAGMDVSFTVKFQPPEQRNLIEGEAVMEIEKYQCLRVKISGACCKLPDPIETIAFECLVRGKQTRSVVITNDSTHTWKLKVEVTGDYFSVDETLQVPSLQFAPCIVTYSPLVMNSENTLHMVESQPTNQSLKWKFIFEAVFLFFLFVQGTLMLKSQDENLYLLYFLRGRSLPPQVTEKISRQFPAKTKYTELLPVHNWLNTQQRFQCKIELLRNDNTLSQIPLYSFVGNERIDVPPNSQRDYRAVFYCYEKWDFYFKVTFTNVEKEYQFYEIEYEVTEPEVIESIKLATPARSQICYALKLENPLERETIKFTAECLHPFVTVTKVSKIVQPLSHEYITIIYHPTMPFITDVVMLNVDSEKLGRFPYELRLKASPAPPEKTTRVNAALGSNYAFSLPVKNFTRENAIFLIHVDSECFACPKNIQVSELSEGIIDVIYEPYDVENATATLIASSDTAGEFIFPLIGSCSLPKPMGPYVITRSSPAFISFKNVFREAKTFDFIVDVAEIFIMSTASTTLNSKQSIDVKVSIRENELEEEDFKEEKYPVTGKLMAYCTDHAFSHINWVYYLRAVFE